MALGFGLISGQRAPDLERSWSDTYHEIIDLTVRAELKGYDSVWTTEHHFVDDGYMPSLLVTSAAMAQATSTISIGTGVLLAPLYHPLRLAEDAATVALLARGRLELGLGLGWSEIEFAALGADLGSRGRAMDEILQILPLAWSGEPFRWDGDVYSFPEIGVRPTPESHIPLIVGGGADAAVRRAALYADGFFSNSSLARFVHQVAIANEELENAGRDPAEFTWLFYASIFPTDDLDAALPHVWHQRWKYSDMDAAASRNGPIAATPALSDDMADKMRKASVIGSSQQIVDYLNDIKSQVDVPLRIMARSHFATLEYARQVEILDQLAEEVLPHV